MTDVGDSNDTEMSYALHSSQNVEVLLKWKDADVDLDLTALLYDDKVRSGWMRTWDKRFLGPEFVASGMGVGGSGGAEFAHLCSGQARLMDCVFFNNLNSKYGGWSFFCFPRVTIPFLIRCQPCRRCSARNNS